MITNVCRQMLINVMHYQVVRRELRAIRNMGNSQYTG